MRRLLAIAAVAVLSLVLLPTGPATAAELPPVPKQWMCEEWTTGPRAGMYSCVIIYPRIPAGRRSDQNRWAVSVAREKIAKQVDSYGLTLNGGEPYFACGLVSGNKWRCRGVTVIQPPGWVKPS